MNNKITSLITGLSLLVGSNAFAQKLKQQAISSIPSHRTCGTMEHHEFLKQTRPNYEKELIEYNKKLDEYIATNKNVQNTNAIITIPVVIHVVYNTAQQNISDAQATSQFQVLNDDFQRHNADTTLGASFYNVAGRVNFQFCLAQRDPNGNPTTGIVHKSTTVTTFSTNDAVKFTAQGGDDAWDVTKYMNIWVCNIGGGILGYGEFPNGSLSNTYGLVLNYTCTGTMGTAAYPYDGGRTGTHEFGHCFNLLHIWGDDNGACSGSDACSDTPNQAAENYGCPTLPHTDACTGTAPGVMCMNYMDYTDDRCMSMFSAQQCARMLAVVSTAPWNILQSSDGCTPVVLVANDAGIFNVSSPTGNLCAGSIQPVTTLKNMGSTALTSCTINYKIDNGTVNTYNWTGSLASLATTSVTLPAITVSAGTHTLTVYTTNPNNGADGNSANDQSTTTFNAIASSTGVSLPFFEGFENTTFVPSNWTLSNPDNADTWARTTAAKKTGLASAKMDNWTNQFTGQSDAMITPAINLSSMPSPQLTFQVAYKLATNPSSNPNYSDTLDVMISTDCGATYTSVYKKFGAALTTTTPTFANSAFTPTAAQWRLETVPLTAFAGAQNAYIKFRNASDYENNLYIDDINITGSVGIDEYNVDMAVINVYPNPSSGNLTVEISNNIGGNTCEISVYNVIGQKVLSIPSSKGLSSIQTIDISTLSNGVYQVEVKSNNKSTFKKIVLNK